ncbi:alpha/beta fold hydrolase [Neobacillus sp. NRS-1170]|uniref:alpha/beta fold hydrolase n=1 Tax=Neobacillus sp. NRS-1170 TaxID=3233898 RepID=UPI003D27E837
MKKAKAVSKKMPFLRMGSGEPLVLLHGLSECKEGWFKQFELSKQYDLIIPDQRGHGENSTLEGISIENFARDVITLLDTLNIESAHFCGYSMGGIVAQEIYRQAPEKCRSIVFACSTPYFFNGLGKLIGEFTKMRSRILSPKLRQTYNARRCFYSWSQENFENIEKCLKPNPEGTAKAIDTIVEVDNRSLLAKINVPTLVLCARYDSIIPLMIPIYMHRQIPNSELVILKRAGHLAKVEVAKEFNQALINFLKKHPMEAKIS